ncbi:carboxypeptidase-like regulatory domain-containing protein [Asanoa siamensis]|uniref:Carboxypeptidase family protein n=1 Tax=Asanoa siamensis TaxID=926357 RepID=A0ABQ4CTT1_9ACTN|nr:carboxypeptidase-like regulatory domain-containing protein [Asanoa siamensis]GIF74698.1 hypothetical protein Asi02nite_42160 [Asanoa siamensis]
MSVSVSPDTLAPGESATVTVTVENNNQLPGQVTVRVSTTFGELECSQGCEPPPQQINNDDVTFTARVTARDVAEGQSRSGQVVAVATINNESRQATDNVTVRGRQQQPPAVQTVKTVTGKVTNQSDGKAVNGAYVALRDGASKLHETFASANGTFRFEGSAQDPIAPGRITIGAQQGEQRNLKTITANAGQNVSGVLITLQVATAPTATPSTVPTEDAPLDEEPTDTEATESGIAAAPAGNTDEGGGFGNWLVVLGGGLLVAFGVGGIVWVMLRRKENDDPDGESANTGVRPAVPAGGAAGGYRGGADDATRIAGPPMGGAMADAPTMLHSRPPVDEFPDPYGAPMPQPGWGGAGNGGYGPPTQVGGYDQSTQMYDGAPTQFGNAPGSGGGYGAGNGYPDAPGSGGGGYGGAPSSGGGYGAAPGGGYPQAGGYGGDQRFDEPTGRYEPASGGGGYGGARDNGFPARDNGFPARDNGFPAGGQGYGGGNGYGDDRGGYAAEPNGYDQGGGNGYGGGQRGGYDQGGGGYDQGGAGYGGGQGGGYDETRGYPAGPGGGADYGRGGYEGGPGYVPEQRGGGNYGGQNGGYDDRGDYQDDQQGGRARHGGRGGDRRELGWLDD